MPKTAFHKNWEWNFYMVISKYSNIHISYTLLVNIMWLFFFKYILSKGHESVCVRERRTREEGDHNILLSHSLYHKLPFPTATLLSQHKEKEVGIKTWRPWEKKREKDRRRGDLRQPGSVGWSENMRQNGYHLIPQRLRSTTHNISYC